VVFSAPDSPERAAFPPNEAIEKYLNHATNFGCSTTTTDWAAAPHVCLAVQGTLIGLCSGVELQWSRTDCVLLIML
jgi:hypothetical protein